MPIQIPCDRCGIEQDPIWMEGLGWEELCRECYQKKFKEGMDAVININDGKKFYPNIKDLESVQLKIKFEGEPKDWCSPGIKISIKIKEMETLLTISTPFDTVLFEGVAEGNFAFVECLFSLLQETFTDIFVKGVYTPEDIQKELETCKTLIGRLQ